MHLGISAAAEGNLKESSLAFVDNTLEVIKLHVGLRAMESVLIALYACLKTATRLAMDTAAHDPDIKQMGIRCHEGINLGIASFFIDNPGSMVKATVEIETVGKAIGFVFDGFDINDGPSLSG